MKRIGCHNVLLLVLACMIVLGTSSCGIFKKKCDCPPVGKVQQDINKNS